MQSFSFFSSITLRVLPPTHTLKGRSQALPRGPKALRPDLLTDERTHSLERPIVKTHVYLYFYQNTEQRDKILWVVA